MSEKLTGTVTHCGGHWFFNQTPVKDEILKKAPHAELTTVYSHTGIAVRVGDCTTSVSVTELDRLSLGSCGEVYAYAEDDREMNDDMRRCYEEWNLDIGYAYLQANLFSATVAHETFGYVYDGFEVELTAAELLSMLDGVPAYDEKCFLARLNFEDGEEEINEGIADDKLTDFDLGWVLTL